jgi:hypothetical protein
MPTSRSELGRALRRLEQLVRKQTDPTARHRSRRLPPEFRSEDAQSFVLFGDQADAFDDCVRLILDDLGLEHLGGDAEDVLWDFVFRAYFAPGSLNAKKFLQVNDRPVQVRSCFAVVHHLAVEEVLEVGRVRFLPPRCVAPWVEERTHGPWRQHANRGTAAAVPTGTDSLA